MNKLIHKTRELLFAKQSSIFSSAVIIAIMIVVSRLFGFLRYRILAGYFSKEELDIYFASFRIPDLIFEIIITGALISSFIPIYIKYQKDKKELSENISSIVNVLSLAMLIFIFVLYLGMEAIIKVITPGFSADSIAKIIIFSRLLLVGQLPFLIIGNFLTGIGQANKLFFLPALAPIVYNIAIILFTVGFATNLGLLAPIFGVIFGAILFLFLQLPIFLKADFKYELILKKTKGLVEFIRIMVPRAVTIIVAQIDATIDLSLTSMVGAGSYTVFYLAQHLQLLPVSVVGVAFGQAALPYLSELYENNNIEEFKKIIISSILNLFFFTIPIMSFFIFARTPLVRLFFGGQKFDWEATVQTALTFSFFSLSLPFHSIYYFLTRCFYAFHNSRIPFMVSVLSIGVNTALSLFFILVLKMPVWSLAISFSVAMILNTVLLFLILEWIFKGLDLTILFIESFKMAAVALFSSLITYYFMRLLDGLILDTTRTINIFILLCLAGGLYVGLYLFLGWLINVKQLFLVSRIFLKMKEYQQRIVEIYTSYE